MANAAYNSMRVAAAGSGLGWTSNTFHGYLVDVAYVFDATHDFLDDVGGATRVAGPIAFAGKAVTSEGAVDADDRVFVAVSGADVEALVIVQDSGVEATSPLRAYIDSGTGLPIVPNGGDIQVTFDSGTNRIFKL